MWLPRLYTLWAETVLWNAKASLSSGCSLAPALPRTLNTRGKGLQGPAQKAVLLPEELYYSLSSWPHLHLWRKNIATGSKRNNILILSTATLPFFFFSQGSYEQRKMHTSFQFLTVQKNSRSSLCYYIFKWLASGANFSSLWNLISH